MESLIYIANLLYLTSYLVRDILRLRLLTVVAALCLVAYFYCREEPMMTVVYWNLFFVTLNVVQILRLLLGRFGTGAGAANHLRSLSDQHLKDIGIHRSEITSVVYGRAGDRIRIHDVR